MLMLRWVGTMLGLAAVTVSLGCAGASSGSGTGGVSRGEGRGAVRETEGEADRSTQEAMQILSEVGDKYRGLESFRCRQISQTRVQGLSEEVKGDVVVYFERPDRLRIEAKDADGHVDVLVASAQAVWVRVAPRPWIHGDLSRKEESLSLALAGFQGASAGRVWMIPSLLGLPGASEQSPLLAENARVAGEEIVDGHMCYRIEGARGDENEVAAVTYWIDKELRVLRRLESRATLGDGGSLPYYLQAYETQGEEGRRFADEVRAMFREHEGAQVITEDTFSEITLDPSIPAALFAEPG